MVETFTSGQRQFNLYNFFIILAVSFGSMSYGYASSAIAPVLALPEFLDYFDLETRSNGKNNTKVSQMRGLNRSEQAPHCKQHSTDSSRQEASWAFSLSAGSQINMADELALQYLPSF